MPSKPEIMNIEHVELVKQNKAIETVTTAMGGLILNRKPVVSKEGRIGVELEMDATVFVILDVTPPIEDEIAIVARIGQLELSGIKVKFGGGEKVEKQQLQGLTKWKRFLWIILVEFKNLWRTK